MRTRIIFTLYIVLGASSVFAQEAGKFRAGFEEGYLFPSKTGSFGFLGAIELKYNLQNNMNVGLKVEAATTAGFTCYGADVLSLFISYEYYFHSTGRRSSPFLGAGFGYCFSEVLDCAYYGSRHAKFNNPTCFIRAGYEIRKFRVSLTYNLIRNPNAKYYLDYASLNVGFYIGGGKWK